MKCDRVNTRGGSSLANKNLRDYKNDAEAGIAN